MTKIDAYKVLEENIADKGNRPIFFIGSGMTRRYLKGPNWKGLLEQLINKASIKEPYDYFIQKCNGNYEKIASVLQDIYFEKAWEDKKQYKKEYYTDDFDKSIYLKDNIANIFIQLADNFDSKPFHNELELFSKTNPTAIITTNYDELLENNIFKSFKTIIGQRIISETTKGKNGKILKIHGCVTKPNSIIISEEDYENFIDNQKYLSAKLLAYFVEYPIVIMGYSLSDRNILGILETISGINFFGKSRKQKASNIWFISYSTSNLDKINELQEKEIILPNNKTLYINYMNVMTYNKLFESIVEANKYPYSITSVANELEYDHWKQIEKYMKIIEKKKGKQIEDIKQYCAEYKNIKRYSEDFVKEIRKARKYYAQQYI